MKVITVSGRGRSATYSLKPRHWELAKTHLTYGEPIPVVALATFLYRDYGILNVGKAPDANTLAAIFRQEFGYNHTESVKFGEFNHLFLDDSQTWLPQELFEEGS